MSTPFRTATPGPHRGRVGGVCGRYVLISSPEALVARFGVDEVRTEPLPTRYNVAPSQDVYAVVAHAGHRRLGALRWGFVPRWARTLRDTPQPINARLETLATGRMFAEAAQRRRCLLPADGFYEWLPRGERQPKQPYHLAPDDGAPLAFAGVWSLWRDPDDGHTTTPLATAAIVTTAARDGLEDIHPRMPLMLPPDRWEAWLTAPAEETAVLLADCAELPAPSLRVTAISGRVNNVRNDGPELLTPAG